MKEAQPLFAKQPIFDSQLNVTAYELLFRSDTQNSAKFIDGDHATSHVLMHAFGEREINDLTGGVPVFINFTENLLVNPPNLSPKSLVIEVLEDVAPNRQVLEALKKLKQQGYKIALDDFFLTKETQALVAFADIIKVDILAIAADDLEQYVTTLKRHKVTLLAEKIETYESMERCRALGFELFQGYFLAKPHIVKGNTIPANKTANLPLIAALSAPNASMDTVTQIIASDRNLSEDILRIVNISEAACQGDCDTIARVASRLGLSTLRKWALLLTMASHHNKPFELCALGMTRAKFSESIGAAVGDAEMAEQCFTTGILSTFDAFLDIPMKELLNKLKLAKEIEQGLTGKNTAIGQTLYLTQCYEAANWTRVEQQLNTPVFNLLTDQDLSRFYVDALNWTQSTLSKIQ